MDRSEKARAVRAEFLDSAPMLQAIADAGDANDAAGAAAEDFERLVASLRKSAETGRDLGHTLMVWWGLPGMNAWPISAESRDPERQRGALDRLYRAHAAARRELAALLKDMNNWTVGFLKGLEGEYAFLKPDPDFGFKLEAASPMTIWDHAVGFERCAVLLKKAATDWRGGRSTAGLTAIVRWCRKVRPRPPWNAMAKELYDLGIRYPSSSCWSESIARKQQELVAAESQPRAESAFERLRRQDERRKAINDIAGILKQADLRDRAIPSTKNKKKRVRKKDRQRR